MSRNPVNFIIPGRASVLVGGQFGSEAKGLAASYLAQEVRGAFNPRMICTTNAGAQAGHTTVLDTGTTFVCYHLPTIGALTPQATIYINAGSIIDPELLDREIHNVAMATGENEVHLRNRIIIHPQAAVIRPEHKVIEGMAGASVTKIGSTQKGVGAALAAKIRRDPTATAGDALPIRFGLARVNLMEEMARGAAVTVEVPQGTGLSLNNGGFFPYCTSRDCWVGQGLADAGIHPDRLGKVAMVCRTFPIRVGNIMKDGELLGTSGPFYDDGAEIAWDFFRGVKPEITTVTKRVRRIAKWSRAQFRYGLGLNRPDYVFLTFVNYLYHVEGGPSLYSFADDMVQDEAFMGLEPLHIFSWGPRATDCSINPDEAHEMGRGVAVAETTRNMAA